MFHRKGEDSFDQTFYALFSQYHEVGQQNLCCEASQLLPHHILAEYLQNGLSYSLFVLAKVAQLRQPC